MNRPEVSELTEQIYASLGAFAKLDPANDYHLLRHTEAWARPMLGDLYEIVRDRDDRPGWAVLFDPDEAPAEALPYLAQFPGATLTESMTEAERRAEIKNPSGWRRGTLPSMIQAIKRALTGSKIVLIEERFNGSAYRIWVRTIEGETPDPAATEAAMLSQKPVGIVPLYEVVVGLSWNDLEDDYGTWADVEAAFDDWAEVVSTPPSAP